jgi:hypothetical protein
MYMRYQWGKGIGHQYSHDTRDDSRQLSQSASNSSSEFPALPALGVYGEGDDEVLGEADMVYPEGDVSDDGEENC